MNDKPKLSIITVCYNEKRLQATCESITRQSWQGFEWIVIDGGSNEETLATFAPYRDRMAYFVSEKDRGIFHAMNKGLAQAKGEYVLFLNAGDYFLDPYSLEWLYEREPWTEDIIVCDAVYFEPKGGSWLKTYDAGLPVPPDYFYNYSFPHQATLIRRSLMVETGGYNEAHRIVSDTEKWIELIVERKATCRYMNQVLSIQNMCGTSSVWEEDHLREREEMFRRYYPQEYAAPNAPRFPRQLGKPHTIYSVNLFHCLPLLHITEQCRADGRRKLKVYLFRFIPLLRIMANKRAATIKETSV